MKNWNHVLALLLAVVLCVSLLPIGALAVENNSMQSVETDYSVEGTTSVGRLITNTMENTEEEEGLLPGCISDVTVLGTTATVDFNTDCDSDLIVAIYTEDGMQMLGSGYKTVTSAEESADVVIEIGEMPEFFVVGAYLLDAESHEPLSIEYISRYYTREFQEFLSMTAEDFDEDRILNLDNDVTTNYLVFSENTILVEETVGVNEITDNGDGTYTIRNADEQFLNLQTGDSFAYTYDNGTVLIVVVASASVDGTTVTVVEDTEADLVDVFDYVKIDGISDPSASTVDTSYMSDMLDYEGTVAGYEAPSVSANSKTMTLEGYDSLVLDGAQEIDASAGLACSYSLKTPIGEDDDLIELSGSLTFSITAKLNLYIIPSWQFVKVLLETSAELSIQLEGTLAEAEIPLGEYTIPTNVPGVALCVTPAIVLEVKASVEWKATLKMTIGGMYDSDDGFTNLCSGPKIESEWEVSGTVFLGLSMEPELEVKPLMIINKKLAGVSLKIKVGAEAKVVPYVNMHTQEEDKDEIHDCELCYGGTVTAKGSVSFSVDIGDGWITKTEKIADFRSKIGNFYWSVDYNEVGFTTCPHISYKTTITVVDQGGLPIEGASVEIPGDELVHTTDADGQVVVYLANGKYAITVSKDNLTDTDTITVKDGKKTAKIRLVSEAEDDEEQGEAIDSGTCGDDLTWTLFEDGTLVITGTGAMDGWRLPPHFIDPPWYGYQDFITHIVIGSGVTNIGGWAFFGCSALTSVTIPESVTDIGAEAFANCSSLVSVTIPESVIHIWSWAFRGCSSLTSVTIPAGVTNIYNGVFGYCGALTSINVDPGSERYTSVDGVLFDKNMTTLVAFPGAGEGEYEIPAGVTKIGMDAFRDCSLLTGVTIPESVTSIEACAFYDCSALTSITIPEGVMSIEDCLFTGCSALASVTIPSSVTSIGDRAFRGCSALTSVTIPESVTSIGEYLFSECASLTSITIPHGVTSIGERAFEKCYSLKSVTIPDGVTAIGEEAFNECWSLESVTIPEGVTSINNSTFTDCYALKSVTIPEGVSSIGDRAFCACSALTSITIPSSVTSIEGYAFFGCSALTSVTIPEGVTSIGDYAFCSCGMMRSINVDSGNECYTSVDGVLFNKDMTKLIACPGGKQGDCDVPVSVTSIGESAFYNCRSLTSVTIPDSVTYIGSYAFYDCSSLTDVYYGGTETDWAAISIGSDNFRLTSATIHYNATSAAARASDMFAEAALPEMFVDIDDAEESDTLVNPAAEEDMLPSPEEVTEVEDFADEEPVEEESSNEESTDEEPVEEESSDEEMTETEPLIADSLAAYTGAVTAEGTTSIASFADLVPGAEYVMVVTANAGAEELLAPENLLFVAQGTASDSGSLAFSYIPREGNDDMSVMAYGLSNQNLADATITVEQFADGSYQVMVIYGDEILLEDEDYTLLLTEEDNLVTVTVKGLNDYAGTQTVVGEKLSTHTPGDVDGDGEVTGFDASLILQYEVGLIDESGLDLSVADVDGDGEVTGFDASLILQYEVGLIDSF